MQKFNMQKHHLLQMLICLLLCTMALLSCSDDHSVADDEETQVQTPYDPTDQMKVKSSRTLYFLADYDVSPKRDLSVLDHLLKRFSKKESITDAHSLDGMHEGDYLILEDLDTSIISVNDFLRHAVVDFYRRGGIFLFVQVKAEDVKSFFREVGIPMSVSSDDCEQSDEMRVYYQPTNSPTRYSDTFNGIKEENANLYDDRTMGRMADNILIDTEGWVKESSAAAGIKALANSVADVFNNKNKPTIHDDYHDTYPFYNNNYYTKEKAPNGGHGGIDDFAWYWDVWTVKDEQGTRYVYAEFSQNLDFGAACCSGWYKKKCYGLECKIWEWYGRSYEWRLTVEGPENGTVTFPNYAPKTIEKTSTFSSGFDWSVSGSVTGGYECGGAMLTGTFGGGVSFSSNRSFEVHDVEYMNHTNYNEVKGIFTLKRADSWFHGFYYGSINISAPADVARSTFTPQQAVLIRIAPQSNAANTTLNLKYHYDIVFESYRGYWGGQECDHYNKEGFTPDIVLSDLKY